MNSFENIELADGFVFGKNKDIIVKANSEPIVLGKILECSEGREYGVDFSHVIIYPFKDKKYFIILGVDFISESASEVFEVVK